MVLTDNDMLIIYCCVGGGVGLALILLIVFLCRRRRQQRLHESQRHRSQRAGGGGGARADSNERRDPMTYRSLNHDDDDDGGPTDDHWRKKSKITHDSSNTGGGGDLADYLQNLVDGMERGRAQTLHQNSSPQQSRQGKEAGNGLKHQQQRRSTVAAATAYSGADQSLLTLVGPSSSTGGTMSPLNREQTYDERQVSAQRWASAVRIGPAVYDGDGNELSGEKVAAIERWREHVARETASTYATTQGTASDNNGPSSTASLVSRSDELSPSSFVMPNTLVGREQDSGLYNDGEDEDDDDDFGNNDNDGGRSAQSSV
jgi:hypothetical protein